MKPSARVSISLVVVVLAVAPAVATDLGVGFDPRTDPDLALALATRTDAASSQEALDAPSWGTADSQLLNLSWADASSLYSTSTWEPSGNYIYRTGGPRYRCTSLGGLPNGASLAAIRVYIYDSNVAFDTAWDLSRSYGEGLVENLATVSVQSAGGFGAFWTTFPTPLTIDHGTNTYLLCFWFSPSVADDTLRFLGFKVRYDLQVSPAPTMATFTDVPTSHPFFQYVEALADSGITAGCRADTFCPDSPLTRGQMAVFLAKALGLHFPAP